MGEDTRYVPESSLGDKECGPDPVGPYAADPAGAATIRDGAIAATSPSPLLVG